MCRLGAGVGKQTQNTRRVPFVLSLALAIIGEDAVVVEASLGEHVRGRFEARQGHELRVHVEFLFLEELEDGVLIHRVTVDPKEGRRRRQVVLSFDQHVGLAVDDSENSIGVAVQRFGHCDDRVDDAYLFARVGQTVVDVQFEIDTSHVHLALLLWQFLYCRGCDELILI